MEHGVRKRHARFSTVTNEVFEFDQPATIVHTGEPFEKLSLYRIFKAHQITRLTQLLGQLVLPSTFRQINIDVW